ncbi:MAG: S-methyl-5-thioribose-1-phosphate isomerase [Euryarchaeota archaeon]|nr:S-methyl-5-thioribose-1-phosphate isomerase [Euryarchaeota archaeon]
MGALDSAVRAIASMRVRGAGRIARCAAEALGRHATTLHSNNVAAFRREMKAAAKKLIDARPTAVSLSNAVGLVMRAMPRKGTVEGARKAIVCASREFCKASDSAVEKVGEKGAGLVPTSGKVMTICNSSAVVSVLVHAGKAGKGFEAYACETRPKFQGRITARELARNGVPTTIIVDSASRYLFDGVKAVFVGADAVEWDGSVVNKIGTLQLAACARDFKVPFYVCAESYKFCPPSQAGARRPIEERDPREVASIPGVRVRNPVFDRTPPEMIARIITEHGAIRPRDTEIYVGKHLEGL